LRYHTTLPIIILVFITCPESRLVSASLIPDEGNRPKYVGSLINIYLITISFVTMQYYISI